MCARALTFVLACVVSVSSIAEPAQVDVSLVSVCGKNEGRAQKHYGAGLSTVKRAVAGLDYDTFTKVSSSEARIPFGERTTFFIDSTYSLVVEPLSIDNAGRVRLRTQVMMKSKKNPKESVKALDTVLVMAPGKQLNLGGLKLNDGELVIVLSVK